MPNRLADASSPYLRQHADNPVDWYEWGEEAFAEAARREVPIFLSVGYSSCHWCHVMAHESFEDEEVAGFLNEHFVSVKVDREERPDVDAVYMQAVQALTGRGGWPMSVFLDLEGRPFYGGTYWPRTRRMGMPGFLDVLAAVHDSWTARRNEVDAAAERITTALAEHQVVAPEDALDPGISDAAARLVVDQAWDRDLGGFGGAPKFPNAMTISWLLDRHLRTGDGDALAAATHSLDAMARGGIYDHIGGGFARYSTDARWLVPHFEKMLYDNALLLASYAEAASLTGDARASRVALETAEYLLREMQHPDGGFWSATDADSEGEEGRFFVWSAQEFAEVVEEAGADPERYAAFFGVRPGGNWEGTNILHEPLPRERFVEQHDLDPIAFAAELGEVRNALYRRRQSRVPPGLDDKLLASWNGLAIRGLARAGMLLGEPRYVDAAVRAALAVEERLVVDGVLHHSGKDEEVGAPAFLEDLACLAAAYLDLYEATADLRWYERALRYADDAVARFADPDGGGYFSTAEDAETLYTRPKDTWDNATPSGNSVLAGVFARLTAYTGDHRWHERAVEVVRLFQANIRRMPTGYGYLLQVVEFLLAERTEVAVVGRPGAARRSLADTVRHRPRVGTVLAVGAPGDRDAAVVPLLADRTEVDGGPAAYVCHGFVCDRPVTTPDELAALL